MKLLVISCVDKSGDCRAATMSDGKEYEYFEWEVSNADEPPKTRWDLLKIAPLSMLHSVLNAVLDESGDYYEKEILMKLKTMFAVETIADCDISERYLDLYTIIHDILSILSDDDYEIMPDYPNIIYNYFPEIVASALSLLEMKNFYLFSWESSGDNLLHFEIEED